MNGQADERDRDHVNERDRDHVKERDGDQGSNFHLSNLCVPRDCEGGSAVHSASPSQDVSRDVSIDLNTLKALGGVKDSNEDIESRNESTSKNPQNINYYSATAQSQKASAGRQSSLI